jgi:hypothetical protein
VEEGEDAPGCFRGDERIERPLGFREAAELRQRNAEVVPGVRMGGPRGERRFEGGDGLRMAFRPVGGIAELVEQFGIAKAQVDGPRVRVQRLRIAAPGGAGVSQVEPGEGRPGVAGDAGEAQGFELRVIAAPRGLGKRGELRVLDGQEQQ